MHGRIDRPRRDGKRLTVKADANKLLRVEMPEWRIIDEEIWAEVQAMRARKHRDTRAPGPAAKYPLAGVARCAKCGGAIGVVPRLVDGVNVRAYACTFHHNRGRHVCDVSVRQLRHEVESALADYVKRVVLTDAVVAKVVEQVRGEMERRLAAPAPDVGVLERELQDIQKQKSNLADAIAHGAGAMPALVEAMQQREAREAELRLHLAAAEARGRSRSGAHRHRGARSEAARHPASPPGRRR